MKLIAITPVAALAKLSRRYLFALLNLAQRAFQWRAKRALRPNLPRADAGPRRARQAGPEAIGSLPAKKSVHRRRGTRVGVRWARRIGSGQAPGRGVLGACRW